MSSATTTEVERSAASAAGSANTATGSVTWASGMLLITAVVGIVAKTIGVLVAPGTRGVVSQKAVDTFEILSAAAGYTFAGLLVAVVCGGSFELARVKKVPVAVRGAVVALSGLTVALASPAVVQRLHAGASFVLAIVTSIIVLVAGVTALRAAHTRALGALLVLLAFAGALRPIAWELAGYAGERASIDLYHVARGLSTAAIAFQALATLLAAAWIGTRSRIRGRVLANAAIFLAFALTYFAAGEVNAPTSTVRAVLNSSLTQAMGVPAPYAISTIAAFLLPASLLLAAVTLLQRPQPAAILAATAFALLSLGQLDVPLHSLAITAAAHWALLAMADPRSMWSALTSEPR